MNKRQRVIRLSQKAIESVSEYPAGTWVAIRYERVIGSGLTREEARKSAPSATIIVQVPFVREVSP